MQNDTPKTEQATPRVCVLLDSSGYFAGLVSDVPVNGMIVDPGGEPRVYRLTEGIGMNTGPSQVDDIVGDDAPKDFDAVFGRA